MENTSLICRIQSCILHITSLVADFKNSYSKYRQTKDYKCIMTSWSLQCPVGKFPKIYHYSKHPCASSRFSLICFTSSAAHSLYFITLHLPFYPTTNKFLQADTQSIPSIYYTLHVHTTSISLHTLCWLYLLLIASKLLSWFHVTYPNNAFKLVQFIFKFKKLAQGSHCKILQIFIFCTTKFGLGNRKF